MIIVLEFVITALRAFTFYDVYTPIILIGINADTRIRHASRICSFIFFRTSRRSNITGWVFTIIRTITPLLFMRVRTFWTNLGTITSRI